LQPPLPLELLTLSRDVGCKRVRMLSVSASTRSDHSTCTTTPAQSLLTDCVDSIAACRPSLRAYATAHLLAALPHALVLLLRHLLTVWSGARGLMLISQLK
jgi:hypothetical protein